MKDITQVVLSHPLSLREDINQWKKEIMEDLVNKSFHYLDGFIKLVYHNFIKNERKDVWNRDNLFNISLDDVREQITNPFYHVVHETHGNFLHKAWYNQLNRECDKYFKQISKNFNGYRKFIEDNLNKEILYKNGEIILYKPKRSGKTDALILDSETIMKKISEALEGLSLNVYDIQEELEGKTASDTITLSIEKYNLKPRKYYFHEGQKPIKKLSNKKLQEFLHKKFSCPRVSTLDIPLDDRFLGESRMEKDGLQGFLDGNLNSQFAKDATINNQYFFKLRNVMKKSESGNGNKESIKLPIKYQSNIIDLLKTKRHKKFQMKATKQGFTLHMSSFFNKESKKFEPSFSLRLNTTFDVQTQLKNEKFIRLLGFDLGYNNTLTAEIVEVDRMKYEDYIEGLKLLKPKKYKKKAEIEQDTALHMARLEKLKQDTNFQEEMKKDLKVKKRLMFRGLKLNKKIEFLQQEIGRLSQEKNYSAMRVLYKKISAIQTNSMNHIINKLLKEFPDVIIGEDLNLKTSLKNSKSLNKIIMNIPYSRFYQLLEYKQLLHNGKLSKVMSFYSSLLCPKCFHFDEGNRLSQELFLCQCCGHSDNADGKVGSILILFFLIGSLTHFTQ